MVWYRTVTAGVEWCGIGPTQLVWIGVVQDLQLVWNGVVNDIHSWCGMVWYRTFTDGVQWCGKDL